MAKYSVAKRRSVPQTEPSKAEFIRQLHDLRDDAVKLGMNRVVICIDYAYWEVLSVERPPDPLFN